MAWFGKLSEKKYGERERQLLARATVVKPLLCGGEVHGDETLEIKCLTRELRDF
jgi:hypothetical protein